MALTQCKTEWKDSDSYSENLGIISDKRFVSQIIKNPLTAIFNQTEEN